MKLLTGYLSTLDVLGFSELLYRDGYANQLKSYLESIKEVVNKTGVEAVLFSDSVVLTSTDDSDEAFQRLIRTCSAAFYSLIQCGMPVRGAVAFGHYRREVIGKSVFLAGRPIIEAYRRERAQKWVGMLLCPSVLQAQSSINTLDDYHQSGLRADEADSPELEVPLRLSLAKVPYQDPGTAPILELTGYAIVPMEFDDTLRTAARSIRRVLGSLEQLQLKASDPGAQAKYFASIRWLRSIEVQYDKVIAALGLGKKSKGTTSSARE
jgi:hypothetical protein